MADKGRIGFVGLGLMGQAFTRRLVACGYAVSGYDVVADKVAAAAAQGVRPAASAAEVARACDQVHVCDRPVRKCRLERSEQLSLRLRVEFDQNVPPIISRV